jgi:hypothetical protein
LQSTCLAVLTLNLWLTTTIHCTDAIVGLRFVKEEDEVMFFECLVLLFNMALQLASRRLRRDQRTVPAEPLFCFSFFQANYSVCFCTSRLQFPVVKVSNILSLSITRDTKLQVLTYLPFGLQEIASVAVPAVVSSISGAANYLETLLTEVNALDLSSDRTVTFKFSRALNAIELPPPSPASLALFGNVCARTHAHTHTHNIY